MRRCDVVHLGTSYESRHRHHDSYDVLGRIRTSCYLGGLTLLRCDPIATEGSVDVGSRDPSHKPNLISALKLMRQW